jgi:hypothetical protein
MEITAEVLRAGYLAMVVCGCYRSITGVVASVTELTEEALEMAK